MIAGAGLDIVEIPRIERVYRRYGARFFEKILTKVELGIMPVNPVTFLAGRFAAKEAAVKALGTGFSGGISFSDIEIINNRFGAPVLSFTGTAKKVFSSLGGKAIFISITHERSLACAMVILEK